VTVLRAKKGSGGESSGAGITRRVPSRKVTPRPQPSLSSGKKPNGAAELAKETRRVFHDLHLEQLKDQSASTRLSRVIDTEAMGLPKNYFADRRCADLGCGSHVFGALNLLKLGAKFVHAMDVDASFVEPAARRLREQKKFEGRWQLDVGSLMEAPYGDLTFDFVVCQGVIHHTEDPQQCLCEIMRVLKPGGKAYITVLGSGGIIQRFGLEILRDEYARNPKFAALVDSDHAEEWFRGQLKTLKGRIDRDNGPAYEASIKLLEALEVLIDRDLILSLRDLVKAPKYVGYTEAQFGEMLTRAGFSEWYRFPKKLRYDNIRKVLAPLYFDYQDPLARLLYNDGGTFNIVAAKPMRQRSVQSSTVAWRNRRPHDTQAPIAAETRAAGGQPTSNASRR
jgi:ubiquinone/menaquinone biosynthesis C-methylase UbiE